MATFLSRGIQDRLRTRFEHESVVILEGARATGKTSLLMEGVGTGWVSELRTLMDPAELAAAEQGPRAYIESLPAGTVIDEAQLAEEITLAVKARIDNDPRPGLFLLTGSTRLRRNALGGSDPLAGRTGTPLVLRPMTLGEQRGQPLCVIEALLDGDPTEIPLGPPFTRTDLVDGVARVGLPGFLALASDEQVERAQAYLPSVTALEAFASQDVRNLASLGRYLAGRTSTLVNISEFAGAVEISRQSVDNYLASLEEALLVHRLPGWRQTKDKSETDKAKIHFFDVGVASALAKLDPAGMPDHLGRLSETLVLNELLSQADWMAKPPSLFHWRANSKDEVDVVIEADDGRVVCVEVKSAEAVSHSDFKGIRAFADRYPDRFARGFVFYTGDNVLPFGENLWAVPFRAFRPEKQADDPLEEVLQSISARRAERTTELDQMDSQIEAFVRETELALERLGASIGDDYLFEVKSDEPAPRWTSRLLVASGGQSQLLVRVRVDLPALELSAQVPNARNQTVRVGKVDIDDRSADELIAEVLSASQELLIEKLQSWDDAARSGPGV